jgi:chromobox protein 1
MLIYIFSRTDHERRENASDILDEYLERMGGREAILAETKQAMQGKKRGRPASGAKNGTASKRSRQGDWADSETPPLGTRGAKPEWKVPAGSWEDHVKQLDAAQDEATGKLVVYLTWNGGQKTQHSTDVVYKRCPQKVLPSQDLVRPHPGLSDR